MDVEGGHCCCSVVWRGGVGVEKFLTARVFSLLIGETKSTFKDRKTRQNTLVSFCNYAHALMRWISSNLPR